MREENRAFGLIQVVVKNFLEKYHKRFRSGNTLGEVELREYEECIRSILKHLIDG